MADHLKNQLTFLEEQGIITIITREVEYESGIKECVKKVKRTRKRSEKKNRCLARKSDGHQCPNGTIGEFCGIHSRSNTKANSCLQCDTVHEFTWQHNGRIDQAPPKWFDLNLLTPTCQPCANDQPTIHANDQQTIHANDQLTIHANDQETILDIVATSVKEIESGKVYSSPVAKSPIKQSPSIADRIGSLETQLYSSPRTSASPNVGLMARLKHLEKDILGAAVVTGGKLSNRVQLLEESI